jgi:hypothetical protein
MVQELLFWHAGVAKGSPQGVPIHLIMAREYDPPPVRVLQLHVAAFPAYLHKTHPLQSGMNLLA